MDGMSDAPSTNIADEEATRATAREGLIVVGAGGTGRGVIDQTSRAMQVTLVDKQKEPLESALSDGVECIHGDGTSLLVLREAGVERAYAFVAATGDDSVNIEACRLAVECGVHTVFCRLTDTSKRSEVLALGAVPITVQHALVGAITSRIPGVVVTTSEVGLGQGEILQVRVTAGSLAIGHALKDIGTREFLVAAIYRDGDLVVPHGDTIVNADDQILLVGPPDTLRGMAEYFRVGSAQFPLQFGRSVVAWDRSGDARVLEEAEWLREHTRVDGGLHRITGDDPAEAEPIASPVAMNTLDLDPGHSGQFARLNAIHPGIFVVRAPWQRMLQRRGMTPIRRLFRKAQAPVIIARGSTPYRRILAPVGESETAWMGVQLAIDAARQLGASVTLLHVRAPKFVAGESGSERAMRIRRQAEDVARLYNIEIDVRQEEGNPIKLACRLAEDHQLCVVARRRGQSDTYLAPDVGLRIALGVPCSAMVLNRG